MPSPRHTRAFVVARGYHTLRRGRVSLPHQVYLVTVVTANRRPVFRAHDLAEIACRGFDDADLLGTNRLLAWVLMPDHAHWLLQLGKDCDLSRSVGRIKSGCARRVNAKVGVCERLWQPGFHDHAIRTEESLEAIAKYVCENPVRAGLVERVRDYPYWGSVWR